MPRAAKSAAIHQLQGTVSEAKPLTDSQVPPGRPRYPKNLSPEARTEFKRLCRQLEARRTLTEGDGQLLEIAAQETARYRRACAKLDAEGEVKIYIRLDSHGQQVPVEKENHWLKIKAQAEKTVIACLDRLGLSPLNKDKVKGAQKSLVDVASDTPGTGAYYLKHGTWEENADTLPARADGLADESQL